MAEVDTSAWDGPQAMSDAAKSDDPAAAYKAICAGRREGDPSKQSSWALPHHKHSGDPPNEAGVKNALARLPNTEGLTNRDQAESHLKNHMKDINPDYEESADAPMSRRDAPVGGRMVAFPAQSLRAQTIEKDGKEFYEIDGYATVFDTPYIMYDMFGEYTERVDRHALDKSLENDPDVAFLVNHRGVTMARTTNGSLELSIDDKGLHVHALLNAARQDVRDLAIAIIDKNVDQMSFAFMLNDGTWNKDLDDFTITEADVNRGDVSAVNYGANPYTSISARAKEWVEEAEKMPESARKAVYGRLLETFGREELMEPELEEEMVPEEASEERVSSEESESETAIKHGSKTTDYRTRLRLLDSK